MFKTAPIIYQEDKNRPTVYLVVCPVSDAHRIEPIETFNNRWECQDCGIYFEVDYAI
jgi:hypothetical protein